MQILRKIEWLTLAEAAVRAGRSYAWARDRAASGAFVSHPDRSCRIRVTAESVSQAIARERTKQRRKAPLSRPRLVVDNTK